MILCSDTPRRAGLITCNGFSGRQIRSLWTSPCFLFLYPSFYCWASMMPHGVGHPFGHWHHLSWFCPLPAPGAPLASSLAGQHEKWKSPWLCVSTALQQQKHQCVITSNLIKNPNYSIIRSSLKKINAILAITMPLTHLKRCSLCWNIWNESYTQFRNRFGF